MERRKPVQQVIDKVLELNEEYWHSRQSSNVLNSMKHYKNEHLIKDFIDRVISYNKALDDNERIDILDTFKAHDVDFDARSQYEDTTLLYDYAQFYVYDSQNNDNEEYLNKMKLLLDYGANPNFYRQDKDQQTCLMESIQDRDRFKLLLDYGADPTFIPNQKWSDISDFISNMLVSVKQKASKKHYDIQKFMVKSEDLKINSNYAQSLIQKELITNQLSPSQSFNNLNVEQQNNNQSNTIVSNTKSKKQKPML